MRWIELGVSIIALIVALCAYGAVRSRGLDDSFWDELEPESKITKGRSK